MARFQLSLDDFQFPQALPNGNANFRFVVDIRYFDGDDFSTARSVLPGLDTYWECDSSKQDSPNFVRDANNPKFNMNLIDEWARLVIATSGELHSVQVKVYDVNRQDFWDKLKEIGSNILGSLLGTAKTAIQNNIPKPISFLTGAFGTAFEDVESYTLGKLSNGEDKLVFRGAVMGRDFAGGAGTIRGKGSKGEYVVKLRQSAM